MTLHVVPPANPRPSEPATPPTPLSLLAVYPDGDVVKVDIVDGMILHVQREGGLPATASVRVQT